VGGDVGHWLTKVNAVLEHFPPRNTLMTMLLVELHPAAKTFRYTSAAHPFGYVFDAAGELKQRLQIGNDVPLGIVANHVYQTSETIQLESGETILMVSDGVLEAGVSRHQQFGEQRLLATVAKHYQAPVREIIQAVMMAGAEFRQGHPAEDDATVVVIRAARR
jgi:sigma-B regulation protein RsbU (phosphoserine phosphatase)